MAGFEDSHLGKLRALVGNRLLLMPGARVVIENEQRQILLQLRSDLKAWGLPGGIPEPGETLEACVIREIGEETGLSVRDIRPFGFADDPSRETITYPNGDRAQFFVLLCYSRRFEGKASVADDESLEVAWFDADALPDMLPNMTRTIDAYRVFMRTGDFQTL